jgi:hypothetical protein
MANLRLRLNDMIVRGVCDRMPVYPRVSDNQLSYNLFRRKELKDCTLDAKNTHMFSDATKGFNPLKSQELQKRMFSYLTPYRKAFFFHGVGTGKTTLFSMIVENHKSYETAMSEGYTRKPALVISPNDIIANNYIKDIKVVGRYQLHNDRYFSGDVSKRESLKADISKSYVFETMGAFVNKINKASDDGDWEPFIDYWSGRIVIIDEVHSLSVKDVYDDGRYDNMKKFPSQLIRVQDLSSVSDASVGQHRRIPLPYESHS